MFDAGIAPEHAQNVVAGCQLAVAAIARLGEPVWALLDLAAEAGAEQRPTSLTAALKRSRDTACSAMVDYARRECREAVLAAAGLREHPRLDLLLAAVDATVTAALLADRLDPHDVAVLTAPRRALTELLARPPATEVQARVPAPRRIPRQVPVHSHPRTPALHA